MIKYKSRCICKRACVHTTFCSVMQVLVCRFPSGYKAKLITLFWNPWQKAQGRELVLESICKHFSPCLCSSFQQKTGPWNACGRIAAPLLPARVLYLCHDTFPRRTSSPCLHHRKGRMGWETHFAAVPKPSESDIEAVSLTNRWEGHLAMRQLLKNETQMLKNHGYVSSHLCKSNCHNNYN